MLSFYEQKFVVAPGYHLEPVCIFLFVIYKYIVEEGKSADWLVWLFYVNKIKW